VLSQTSFAHRSEFVQHIFSFYFNQSRLNSNCDEADITLKPEKNLQEVILEKRLKIEPYFY
jgi:hypothetical protein